MEKEKQLYIKKLSDDLYLLDEAHEATGYLLIGTDRACLIDTMNGYVNLKEATGRLTDKPVVVVNTHGHPDHIFGNVFFDGAYLNPVDLPLAESFMNDEAEAAKIKEQGLAFPPFEPIAEGDVIDLGGITLKAICIPGHTPGGIMLLCPEKRILFTGDSVNHHLWMQLGCSLSIEEMAENLEKLLYLENEADHILHGHAQDFDDISLLSDMLAGEKEIVAGKTEDDKPYEWFGGVSMYHPFAVTPGRKYSQEDHRICYDPANVRKK